MRISGVYKLALASILSVVILMAAGGQAMSAGNAPKLELKMTMAKEAKQLKDGKEVVVMEPADNVKPGDVVVYTISYTNKGAGEARDAKVVDPIPQGMIYAVGSAEGRDSEITCSIDGGKTFHGQPVKVTVKNPDGTKTEKDAAPSMYTHIKWVVKSVLPGKSGKLSFKAKL